MPCIPTVTATNIPIIYPLYNLHYACYITTNILLIHTYIHHNILPYICHNTAIT